MTDCTYCGCDVHDHDPLFVAEGPEAAEGRADGPGAADAYCNYACLSAHIDEAGLAAGATCRLSSKRSA